ncbi:MAG: carbohydrate deacetylase [Armatimonadota bacterium]
MSKYLIINADGYGFTRGINRGIEEAVDRGVITSISVNANFDASEDLPAFVREFPQISVGVHVNPVVGRPIADPKDIPTLVNAAGEFHYHDFAARLMRKQIDLDELLFELSLQVKRVRDWGVQISHLDSHQNQHLYPPYFQVFLKLLTSEDISRMRTHAHFVLAESAHPRWDAVGFYLRHPYRLLTHTLARYEMGVARRHGIRMADRLMSTSHTGDKAVLALWLQLLRNVPEGWSEVFCHPAYPDDELRRWATYVDQRRTEIEVMTCRETRETIERCGIELKSFHDL